MYISTFWFIIFIIYLLLTSKKANEYGEYEDDE